MRLKNEVMVGVVVLLALLLAVVGALWLSGKPWAEEQVELRALFDEVGELKEGNPVKFRGVQVGRVTHIELGARGEGVQVTMEVRPDIQMPPSPAVLLAPASLFGDWQASIVPLSSQPNLQFTRSRIPEVLPGATLPDITELTAVGARIAEDLETLSERVETAFTEETALEIRRTISNVEEISRQLSGFVEAQTQTFDQVSNNALAASQNIERTTARVEQVATRLDAAVDPAELEAMVSNARQATENLQRFTQELGNADVPGLAAQLRGTLNTADQVVAQLQPAVAEVQPTIAEARAAMETLQRAAARIEQGEGTLGRLLEDPALYEESQAAIATLRRLLSDVQANPGKYIGAVKIF